jgi:putative nucleotidyltransferase with HDIG domain
MKLMHDRGMPPHIIRHSHAVRLVAVCVAATLKKAGFMLDMSLVDRAALLHDICKADSLLNGGDHALMGRRLMDEQGYPRIGEVVGQHVRLETLEVNEAMVVNYSDKRVMHDRVVSLQKRFLDLMDRYGKNEQSAERILKHYADASEVELILVRSSGLEPGWLNHLNLVADDHALDGGEGLL